MAPTRTGGTGAFDGCPACLQAAEDAIVESVLYLLASAAPTVLERPEEPAPIEYGATVALRLRDADGRTLLSDELEVHQLVEETLEDVSPEGLAGGPRTGRPARANTLFGAAGARARAGHELRLDDLQVVVDRLELTAAGGTPPGVAGRIEGKLFAFERLVGAFQIDLDRSG
jgi:hypothetical protein